MNIFGFNAYFEVKKWLIMTQCNNDIFINDDQIFKNACNKKELDIVKWLVSISNGKYIITLYNNEINYTILDNIVTTCDILLEDIIICCICEEKDSDIITVCKHQFCYKCIKQWLLIRNVCPYCNKTITLSSCATINIKN